jgi:hypothetical protein
MIPVSTRGQYVVCDKVCTTSPEVIVYNMHEPTAHTANWAALSKLSSFLADIAVQSPPLKTMRNKPYFKKGLT